MATYQFDPGHSELSQDQDKLKSLVEQLESRLGHQAKIVGILEIGSFTKNEAVPSSDSDLRIYVESPEIYFWQGWGANPKAKTKPEKENYFSAFEQVNPGLPRVTYDWDAFNNPVSNELSGALNINFEFGITDSRFVEYQLDNLMTLPNGEYELLFQGRILYDPQKILLKWHQKHYGECYKSLCDFYQTRYLDRLLPEVAIHTEPDHYDKHKIEKSGQILWVKWAVRAVRDAIASKTYQKNGKFVFKKEEILDFCKKYLPQHEDFINQLYAWKTDPIVRTKMVADFIANPTPFFEEFASLTPKLEAVVADINKLEL
ncbi:MAG: hypothetical protein ACYC44_01475 [Patescibacteria group bacterium]